MSNVPPGGGFPPPPSGPPPGGGFPPPPSGGGFPPPPPGGGGYGAGGFQGNTSAPVEFQDRITAGLIDYVGPFLAAIVLSYISAFALLDDSNLLINPFGVVINLAALAWALYQGYLAGQTGQSMGMKQAGLRLVDTRTGQNLGGSQGLVRNLLFLTLPLCGCVGWFVVGLDSLFPLWDPQKQTLRDKIAKSIVVKA
jgi:uncharacterized RDD family membrane protein YckC